MLWRQVVANAGATKRPDAAAEPVAAADFRGSFSGRERDVLFFNPSGAGPFIELAYSLGLDSIDDGRAVVPIDFDGDGDLDLATASLQRLRLLENTSGGHFLRVRLADGSRVPFGAEVVVTTGDVVQRDRVVATAGFMSQVSSDLHFGLGEARRVDRLEVRWPDGTTEAQDDLPIDRLVLWARGAAPKVEALPSWPKRSGRVGAAYDGHLSVRKVAGGAGPLIDGERPTVVNFWAPWCAPCEKELPMLAGLARANAGSVAFVGVSLETEDRASVLEAIEVRGLGYDQRLADPQVLRSFFGSDGEATLPATFVLDATGRLRRAFHRPIDSDDLEGLLANLAGSPPRAHDLLLLGDGAFASGDLVEAQAHYAAATAADPRSAIALAQLGAVLTRLGEVEAAIVELRAARAIDPELPYAAYRLGFALQRRGDLPAAIASFREAVELRPQDPSYLEALGAAQSANGADAEAVGTFRALVRAHPDSVQGWLNLGKVLANSGQPGAVEAFSRVLALDPSNPQARALIAQQRR